MKLKHSGLYHLDFLKIILCAKAVPACLCVCPVHARCLEGQRQVSETLEVELGMAVSCPVGLGAEPLSFARTARALSPVPSSFFVLFFMTLSLT